MNSFKEQTINGISWSVGSQILKVALNLSFTAVLARLLLPSEYGIVGMVTVATGFLVVLKDFGFGAALVQKKSVASIDYSSVFWLNIVMGFFLGSLVFLGAPLISSFYEEPKIIPIARIISLSFILNGLLVVPNNILLKQIKFKEIFVIDISALTISGITGIILAFLGFSYWSIVAQGLVSQFTTMILTYYFSRWRPLVEVSMASLKNLRSFSVPLIADQAINYWVRNLDNLLIGKFLGAAQLGYYSKAYSLMLLPVRQLSGTITKVLFPSFSTIQDDLNRIRNVYLRISAVIALLTFPLMMLLYFIASDLILILFGPNWMASVPIFRVLCILGAFQSISTLSGNIYLSQGKTALMFKVGLVTRGLMISGIIIGLTQGLMGVVYGYTLTSVIASLIEWHYTGKILGAGLAIILRNLLPYFIFSLVMGLFLYGFQHFIEIPYIFSRMTITSLIGLVSYIALINSIKSPAFVDIKNLIKEKRL